MHINNVSQKTSLRPVVHRFLVCTLFSSLPILFFNVIIIGQELGEPLDMPTLALAAGCTLIWFVSLIVLIRAIILRYLAVAAETKNLNLKSVDFLSDRVKFNFSKPQYDFSCGYTEINKLEMIIHTAWCYRRCDKYIEADEFILNFTVINNKHFTLKNFPITYSKFVYGVIDAGRAVENFSYRFEGAGEHVSLKERIEKYLNGGGHKKLFTTVDAVNADFYLSFAGLIMCICCLTENSTSDFTFFFLVSIFCMACSFVFDIILLINKHWENKHGKFIPEVMKKDPENMFEQIRLMLKIMPVLKIITVLIIIILILTFSSKNEKITKTPQVSASTGKDIKTQREFIDYPKDFERIRVNQPMEYNYLTKHEIYDIRKRYVERSIFASEDYEPNEEVFGQIVDKKPWYGSSACNILNYKGDYHENIEGLSKVSTQVNNPNALVGVILIIRPWADENNEEFCNGEYNKFLPVSLSYNEKENLILAKYRVSSKFPQYRAYIEGKKYGYPLKLSGLNARDFGYKYVYAFETNNIKMMHPERPSVIDDVRTFEDFIHLGTSCNYAGGCNNISPMQEDLTFLITDLPAEINLKLWKKSPLNKRLNADFNYKIIFEAN